jgi:tetratricopeptide (TPR) repeat protein
MGFDASYNSHVCHVARVFMGEPQGGSMHISFRKLSVLAAFLILLMLALPAMAQNRIIRGKIVDDKGEPIVGAAITIQGVDVAGRAYHVKTDKKGEYIYMGLPAGEYRVVARAQGFAPNYYRSVRPSMGEESVVDLKLTPGPSDQKLPFEYSAQEKEQMMQEAAKEKEKKKFSAEVKADFESGLQLSKDGKYEEAIAEYKKALELDPGEAYILGNMAEAYSKLDKNAEALEAYQKAIALKPDDSALQTNLGVVLGKMGKTAESQEAFKKAAALNPGTSAQSLYNLGATLVNSGKTAEAADAFKKAIEADANFAEAYYQLGMCLSGSSDTISDAIKALQKYIQIGQKPDQVDVAKQIIKALEQSTKKK